MEIGIPDGICAPADAVAASVREAGADCIRGAPSEIRGAEPDLVIASGDRGMIAAVDAGFDAPILPIDTSPAMEPIDRSDVPAAIESLIDDEADVVSRARLQCLTAEGSNPTGLTDAKLMTQEPAAISEFKICSGDRTVGCCRADGIVVATATGSGGYARAAGGPIIGPEMSSIVVVPVSPYRTDPDHWSLPGDDLSIAVKRDDGDVLLYVDDDLIDLIAPGEPVNFETDPAAWATIRVPVSRSPFRR